VGEEPQDLKYRGEPTTLDIGDRNTIREFTTLCRGTKQGTGTTRLGDDNLVMAYAHVAHDCVVGNHTVFANGASLAGHVEVADWAILGGYSLIHQFCRLGTHSFCAMGSAIRNDVPPFVTVSGDPATPNGINSEGLRRRQFSTRRIQMVKQGYRIVYRSGLRIEEAVEQLRLLQNPNTDLLCLAEFIASSERGIVR
jgi:UDP-N-acetylglucosamine acyltransferase